MINSTLAEVAADNKQSFYTLVRIIRRFQGKFSLTLAYCDNTELRSASLQYLREHCSAIEYQELTLEPTTKRLYQTIFDAVQDIQPKALIVSGLESVIALDDLLADANLKRDQFKDNLPFPLILWVTDSVLNKLIRSASDLKSWAPPPIRFVTLSDGTTK